MADTVSLRVSLQGQREASRDAQRFRRDIREIGDEADRTDRRLGGLSRSFGAFNTHARSFASGVGGRVVGAFSAIGSAAARVAGIGLAAVTAAVGLLGREFVQTAANMEQAEIGFETLLGSAQAAADFIGELQQFAAETPFEFPQLQDAAQRFLAFGFAAEEILPLLRTVGDAAAALGAGNEGIERIVRTFGQIRARGVLAAEEVMQLAEVGVPAWQILADHMGVTVPEAMDRVSERAVDASTAIEALAAGMDERFGGLMERQATTMSGLWSNFMDNVNLAGAETVRVFSGDVSWALEHAIGWAERMRDEMPALAERAREAAGEFRDAFVEAGGGLDGVEAGLRRTFGPEHQDLITELVDAGRGFIDVLSAIWDGLRDATRILPDFLRPVEWIRTAFEWLTDHTEEVRTFTTVVGVLVGVVGAWTTAQWLLNAALTANPVGLIIVAIAGLVTGLVMAYRRSETFRTVVQGVLQAVGTAARWVWETVLQPFVTWWVETAWPALSNAIQGAWNNFIKPVLDAHIWFFRLLWDNVLQPFVSWWVDTAWTAISTAVQVAWAIIEPLIQANIAVIEWLWHTVGEPFVDWWTGTAWPAIQRVVEVAGPIIEGVMVSIGNGIDWFREQWNALRTTVSGVWDAIVAAGRRAKDALAGIINPMVDGLNYVIRGLNLINPLADIPYVPGMNGHVTFTQEVGGVGVSAQTAAEQAAANVVAKPGDEPGRGTGVTARTVILPPDNTGPVRIPAQAQPAVINLQVDGRTISRVVLDDIHNQRARR